MAAFVAVGDAAPAVELASLLATVRCSGEGQAAVDKLSAELKAEAEAEKYDSLLEKGLFAAGAASKVLAVEEAEVVNAVFNLSFSLVAHLEGKKAESALAQFEQVLGDAPHGVHTLLRIKLLTILFNMRTPATRFSVFRRVVKLVLATNNHKVLALQLSNVQGWVEDDWKLGAPDAVELFGDLCAVAQANKEAKRHKALETLHIKALQALSEAESDQAKDTALAAVKKVALSKDLALCASLLKSNVVQHLKKAGGTYAAAAELLALVHAGSVADFRAFAKARASWIQENDLNESDLLSRMRSLTLCSLGHTQPSHSFADLKEALELETLSNVEEVVIDAVTDGFIEAKIDQDSQSVFLERVIPRNSDPCDWNVLTTKLESWKKNLTEVLTVFQSPEAEEVE